MASEYNSKLISSIYKETNIDKIESILGEMEEISDPVFLYPIYDTYKRFQRSIISHYFIASLLSFNDKAVLDIALKILADPDTKENDIFWIFPILTKYSYFEQKEMGRAVGYLGQFSSANRNQSFTTSSYHLKDLLGYLKNAGVVSKHVSSLKKIVLNKVLNKDTRTVALRYFLKINPTEHFRFFIENYETLKDEELGILLSKELTISAWKGPFSNKLKEIILTKGSSRARDILDQAEKEEETKARVAKKEELQEFSNIKLIFEIQELRAKINNLSLMGKDFGFNLFPQNESLLLQQRTVREESSFKGSCSDLRSLIQDVSPETHKHGLPNTEIKKMLPDAKPDEYKASINCLFLYLKSRGVRVKSDLFGIKNLSRLAGLLGAHPDAKSQITTELKKIGIEKMYINGDWAGIHVFLLGLYKDSLTKLKKALLRD